LLEVLLEVRGPYGGTDYSFDERGIITHRYDRCDTLFGVAFVGWGLDVDETSIAEAAARLRQRPAAVQTEVIAALNAHARASPADRRRRSHRRALAALARGRPPESQRFRGHIRTHAAAVLRCS